MVSEQSADTTQWIMQAQRGDPTAFKQLSTTYRGLVVQALQQLLPAEHDQQAAIQEIFQRVQAQLQTYNSAQPFDQWLQTICENYCAESWQAATDEEQERQRDTELVQRALAGDQDAFAALYQQHSHTVYTHALYRLGNPSEAQEAVQETFQRVYLKLATFDPARRFRTWLLTITSNHCTDLLRRQGSLKRFFRPVSLDEVDYWISDSGANPERQALRSEQQQQVRQALQRIPEKYRELLILFYWNDLSYREISEVTGLKESTIKTRLFRAREQLLDQLNQVPTAT